MPLLPIALMLSDVDTLIAVHRRTTRADVPCEAPSSGDDVVVCGRRHADRYRVPFVEGLSDDAAFTERTQLMRDPMPKCGITGPFFTGCGYVGVSATIYGSGGTSLKTRKLAP